MAHPEFLNALGTGRVVPQVGISESAECMEPRLDTCNAFDALLLIAKQSRVQVTFQEIGLAQRLPALSLEQYAGSPVADELLQNRCNGRIWPTLRRAAPNRDSWR